MRPASLLWLVVAVLSFSTAPAQADTACERLVPFGILTPAGGFSAGCSHIYNLRLGAALGPDGNYILLSYPSCANGTPETGRGWPMFPSSSSLVRIAPRRR